MVVALLTPAIAGLRLTGATPAAVGTKEPVAD